MVLRHVRVLSLSQRRASTYISTCSCVQLHEVFIDQHGCEFDKQTGKLTNRGSFASVTSSLTALRDKGVTTIYLMGALSRDNGAMEYLSQGGVQFQREGNLDTLSMFLLKF